MRGTMIIYAHPQTFKILAAEPQRYSATRKTFAGRLYAAWLVFCGRADALAWDGEKPY